jgi:putative transposase
LTHDASRLRQLSRRILAWRAADRFDPMNTLAVLVDAGKGISPERLPPTVLADGGVENRTAAVEELVDSGLLRRVLAHTEINCSNSIIEAWWRTLKHQWLYLNTLDTPASLRRLVAFYVKEHNARLPHSAFRGQTPDEVYFGTGANVPDVLKARQRTARVARLEMNRTVTCGSCKWEVEG